MDNSFEAPEEKSFDLKTHHRDKKTGRVMKVTPYVMKISRDHGVRYFRDEIEYYANGDRVAPAELSISKDAAIVQAAKSDKPPVVTDLLAPVNEEIEAPKEDVKHKAKVK